MEGQSGKREEEKAKGEKEWENRGKGERVLGTMVGN